jgi:hypothetical protein
MLIIKEKKREHQLEARVLERNRSSESIALSRFQDFPFPTFPLTASNKITVNEGKVDKEMEIFLERKCSFAGSKPGS